jgi:hypothetical protein
MKFSLFFFNEKRCIDYLSLPIEIHQKVWKRLHTELFQNIISHYDNEGVCIKFSPFRLGEDQLKGILYVKSSGIASVSEVIAELEKYPVLAVYKEDFVSNCNSRDNYSVGFRLSN